MATPTMLSLTEILRAGAGDAPAPALLEVVIPYEDRRRSRMRVQLSDGREGALMLPRGTVLRAGDFLTDAERTVAVRVRAADETLSVATTEDPLLLARAAYHLGNRHVPLQVEPGRLSFQHDHVLDGLVRALGLGVSTLHAPFEPEAGGYPHAGTHPAPQAHPHNHSHAHEHEHEHPHAHELEHELEHELGLGLEHAPSPPSPKVRR
jgi:urease accessory protein